MHYDNPFTNQRKMLHHVQVLSNWKNSGDTNSPILIEINLTNICNQACRWCISMYSHVSNPAMSVDEKKIKKAHLAKSGGKMAGLEFDRVKRFIQEVHTAGTKAITWSGGGEPSVHPLFSEIVEFTSNYLEQGIMTNGQFPARYVPVVGNNLSWARISLDTFDPEKYAFHRHSKQIHAVIKNIKELSNYPLSLGLNMNIAEWNMDEIVSFAERGRDLGVNYVQFRPILGLPFEMKENTPYTNHLGTNLLPKIEEKIRKAQELSNDNFKVLCSWDKFKDIQDVENDFGRTYTSCEGHHFMCVLDANGDLNVCMYHLGEDAFVMGNIYQNTFQEIWESTKRSLVIEHCKTNIDFSKCQSCCKLHNLNKMLHYMNDTPNEVNFI